MEVPTTRASATGDTVRSTRSLALAIVLGAAAGGMGWGIRGQYGHETGAMLPGVLVALVLVFLFCPRASSLQAARIVALTAVGISFGGSMTYGQTVGLTHDAPLIGNWSALGWGLLGLFLKGGIWIGFAGAFLGLGLGGRRIPPLEVITVFLVLLGLYFFGSQLVNEPYDPANRRLPTIYFSDDWYWEPETANLKPRRERWAGLLFALIGLVIYLGAIRRERLGVRLAGYGFLAGGLGFALGQSIQAFHAWNPEFFRSGLLGKVEPYMNWWNMMEITFGAVLGGGLALGVWLERKAISIDPREPDGFEYTPTHEAVLLGLHLAALAVWQFLSVRPFDAIADLALPMGVIPCLLIFGGRFGPYGVTLPILALPIAGKTLRQLSYRTDEIDKLWGWVLLFLLPLALTSFLAIDAKDRGRRGEAGGDFARRILIATTWLYFGLNFAFFEFPWPWEAPTGRTPSAAIFLIAATVLTVAAWRPSRQPPTPRA